MTVATGVTSLTGWWAVQAIAFHTPLHKALRMVAAGLVFAGGSAFLLLGITPTTLFFQAVGWVGLALSGGATLVFVVDTLRRRPVVVLDPEGLTVRLAASGQVRIDWDEIEYLVVRQVYGQRMLGIGVRDAARHTATLSPPGRFLVKANEQFGAPLWVAESMLPCTCLELADRIRSFRDVDVFYLE